MSAKALVNALDNTYYAIMDLVNENADAEALRLALARYHEKLEAAKQRLSDKEWATAQSSYDAASREVNAKIGGGGVEDVAPVRPRRAAAAEEPPPPPPAEPAKRNASAAKAKAMDGVVDIRIVADDSKKDSEKLPDHLDSTLREQDNEKNPEIRPFNRARPVNRAFKRRISFHDIAGQEQAKLLIESALIEPYRYTRLYPDPTTVPRPQESIIKGIMLYGVPGTGKCLRIGCTSQSLTHAA